MRSRVALEQDKNPRRAAAWDEGLEGRIVISTGGRGRLYVGGKGEGIRAFDFFDNTRTDKGGQQHAYTTVYEQTGQPIPEGQRRMSLLTVEHGTSGHFEPLDATVTNHGLG